MDFYLGLLQIIGVHTLLGLSAYCVLLTGQVSLAQAGFFAIGAYVAGMLTVLAGWPLVLALAVSAIAGGVIACAVGFPALRVKGLMLVVATIAFGEAVRLFFFNFAYQVDRGEIRIGPHGGEGFRQIRYFPEHGWSTLDVVLFIWTMVALVMAALWWMDRSRSGAVLRAVGEVQEHLGEGALPGMLPIRFLSWGEMSVLVAGSAVNRPLMYGAMGFESFTQGLGTGAFLVLLLRLTEKRFSATQYALLSSLFGLVLLLLVAISEGREAA